MSGACSQASIKKDIAACIGRYVRDILATSSGTVTTYFIYRATAKYSRAFECIITVITIYIDNNHHIALWLTMMEGQQSLTLWWRSFWRWGRKRFTFTFAYKGSQYSVYDNVQPVAPQITHDTWPRIVDAPLTLRWPSFSRWGMEGIAICFAYKGSQWWLYDWLQPIGGVISQEAWPKIVDAPLTLILP